MTTRNKVKKNGLTNTSYRSTWPLIAVVAATVFFLSACELALPAFFTFSDNAIQYLPNYIFNWRSLVETKNIPLVNFHQQLGIPHLSLANSGVLYPPVYLAIAFSKFVLGTPNLAIDVLAWAHLVGSAAITYLLLRQLKIKPAVSAIASLLWITSPYLITASQALVNRSYLAFYLPLNFLLLEKMLERPSLKYSFYLAIAKALLFYQGYVQHEFMLVAYELAFIVLVAIRWMNNPFIHQNKVRFVYTYAVSLILLPVIIAPLLLPLAEARLLSAYRSKPLPYHQFVLGAMDMTDFLKAQVFSFSRYNYIGGSTHIFYAGPFLLGWLALLLINRLRRVLSSNGIMLYTCLLALAFLLSTPAHNILYSLPVFNLFQYPAKNYLYFIFFLTVTTAGISSWAMRGKEGLERKAGYAVMVLSLLLNVAVLWQNKTNTVTRFRLDYPPQMEWLKHVDPKIGRIATLRANATPAQIYRYAAYDFATLFGINHIGGYENPLTPRVNLAARQGLKYDYFGESNKPANQELLDYLKQWSARYIVTSNTKHNKETLGNLNQLSLIHEEPKLLLYENSDTLPYVYENGDQHKEVPFKFGVNQVDIFPRNKQLHDVIITIAPLPNYVAYADGRRLENSITKTNGEPLRVGVPANTEHLVLRYEEPAFWKGVYILITITVMLSCYIIWRFLKRPPAASVLNS